ncbi:MarR family winged helix-turn-helix transcriptional regulator [Thalassobaculum sp.]|uniref:MarR family winged helix-turn-helix transcriptional regulator n=1 Tax=Thalassobaculum sp. TaxID=2022740 RepID=UPI0032EB40AE
MDDPNTGTGSDAGSASIAGEMRCTCAALRRTARRMTQIYDDALKPTGLKLTQYSLLAMLAQAGEPSITDLADLMMMDRTTLTRNLRPLQAAGWVRLGTGGDKRSRSVVLTAKGESTLQAARPVWRQAEASIRGKLGADGGRQLRRLLAETSSAIASD